MEFRHYYLAKALVQQGYGVTIISASYSHLFKQLPGLERNSRGEIIDGINYYWIKVRPYGGAHSPARVLKWFMFAFKLFFLPVKELGNPDVIILSPMATTPVIPSLYLSKKFKCKLIYEVKDIWPLTLMELGGYSPKHPFILLLSYFEKLALKKSDEIVSTLANYGEHMKSLGINRPFHWITNGVDLDELANSETLDASIMKMIPVKKFIIGYTGTLGLANSLESFLDAAALLEPEKKIHFILVGDGLARKTLMEKYGNRENITFIPSIPKRQVQSVLALFDVCFIGWTKERIYDFGISANKLFDYMYSGRPILHAFSGKGDLVKIAGCGITVEAQNSRTIADGIKKIFKMKNDERKKLGKNGKEYVIRNNAYSSLAGRYAELF